MVTATLASDSSENHLEAKDSGIFTWNLETNILNADTSVAELFGLEPTAAIAGLPIQTYIDRIFEDDRQKVAKSIHEAVVTGDAYHEEYRVRDAKGKLTTVLAFGRCFRDQAGNPAQYAGILFPAIVRSKDSDPVLAHIATAHKIATRAGRTQIADALEQILEDLAGKEPEETGVVSH